MPRVQSSSTRPPTGVHELVVVANRLPVRMMNGTWQTSPGGLVRAMLGVLRTRRGAWIGWSGDVVPTIADATDEPGTATSDLGAGLDLGDIELIPVPLDEHDFVHYYERISNGALWPLFHDAIRESTFDSESWAVYEDVNQRFATAVAGAAAPSATVWIHDYHQLLLPAMLRRLRPDLVIGFFLHIPFPPQELFMRLPWREEIVAGLLAADVIGFQRHVGAQNFQALAKRLLGADVDDDLVTVHAPADATDNVTEHATRVGTFPISIDMGELERIAISPQTQRRVGEIRRRLGDPQTVFLGVDRLDYTKGIDLRLHALRTLLDEQATGEAAPDLPGSPIVLVQIAVPGREGVDSYIEERQKIEQLIGDINGQHSTIGYPVVHYLRRHLSLEQLVALYLAADVMLVTPRRDGMNLVAKEFVASRIDEAGVLILSEFAGAADELTDAVLVNPHDPDAIVAAMRTAIAMSPADVSTRMRALRAQVSRHTVDDWATSFLEALALAARPTEVANG